MELEVPDYREFRSVIDHLPSNQDGSDTRDKHLFKLMYLLAARNNEICTKVTNGDKTTRPFGTFLSWQFKRFKSTIEQHPDCFLVKVPVLKRKTKNPDSPKFRYIALPVSLHIEPWTRDLLAWMAKHKNEELGIPLTRQRVYQLLRENLYKPFGIKPDRKEHSLNILRHFRVNHLMSEYDFDPMDLVSFCGWSVKTAGREMGFATGQLDTYLHLRWRKYAPKLFKPLGEVVGAFLA